jgi:hypothetical protein
LATLLLKLKSVMMTPSLPIYRAYNRNDVLSHGRGLVCNRL